MKKYFSLALFILLVSSVAHAQVNEIKGASAGKGRSERGGRASSGAAAYFFIDFAVRTIIPWQMNTLQRRGEAPNILSLEVFGQAAIQPSTYYIFNPRIRGNWGIFLTDFRMNYMIEDKIGGPADLRTDDWQVLGLNLVNTRTVTARLSTGIMHEAFGDGKIFNESAAGISVMSPDQRIGGFGEFRWSRDFSTGSNPRLEASVNVQRKLFDHNAMHMFATGGVMFQRYYNEINVWGVQAGFALKFYRLN